MAFIFIMVNFNQIEQKGPATQRLDSSWRTPYSVIPGNNNDSIHHLILNVRMKQVHATIFRGKKKKK